MVANVCQIVNYLPWERYDKVQTAVSQFKLMTDSLEDHSKCVGKCKWPRYHQDVASIKRNDSYQTVKLVKQYPTKRRQTRLTQQNNETLIALDVFDDVSIHLKTLSDKLFSDLKKQIFDEHITRIIELTRVVTDVASLSNDVKEYGHVTVGLQRSKDFIKAARKLTSTLNDIQDEQLECAFNRFLKRLQEAQAEKSDASSKEIIKMFLAESKLYTDVEVIMQCICTAAVKVSVESSVESLVSRFESHFGKDRQLSEENSLEEMLIAENGPILVHADPIIKRSLDSYFKEHNPNHDGAWHFVKTKSRIYGNTQKSIVLEKLKSEK